MSLPSRIDTRWVFSGRRGRRAKRTGATLLSAEGEKQGAAEQRPLRSASVPRAPNRKEGERTTDERAGEGKDKEAAAGAGAGDG